MFKSSCCAIFQSRMSSAGMHSMAGLEMQPQKNNLFFLNEGAFRELLYKKNVLYLKHDM